MENLLKRSYLAFIAFVLTGFLTIVMLFCKPFMTEGELPWLSYIPNVFFINFYSIFAMQMSTFCYITFFVPGFDFLYVALCVHSIIQFKLLKKSLTNIDFDDSSQHYSPVKCMEDIKSFVQHHQMLIR